VEYKQESSSQVQVRFATWVLHFKVNGFEDDQKIGE
jgi:hypothetical protein